jgi:hypothetical protein
MEKKQMVLLGAGASVPANIPTAVGMGSAILDDTDLRIDADRQAVAVLRFVAGGLALQKGVSGGNPSNAIDIERLFSAVEVLSKREELVVAPFVTQWHRALGQVAYLDRWSESFRYNVDDLFRELRRSIRKERWSDDMRFVIDDFTESLVDTFEKGMTGGHEHWEGVLEYMFRFLEEQVWLSDASLVEFMNPLVRKNNTLRGIATLNYDNVVEVCCDSNNVEIDLYPFGGKDHIGNSKDNRFELIKLHGSIDWAYEPTNSSIKDGSRTLFPSREIRKVLEKGKYARNVELAIIFGSENKLTEKGPFLELFRRFDRLLQDCSKLIAIGYSFGDRHINHVIFEWMNKDPKRKMIVVDRPRIEKRQHALWTVHGVSEDSDRVELMPVGSEHGIEELFS